MDGNRGIRRDDPSTWAPERPAKLQTIARSGAFDTLDCPGLREAVDGLLGEGSWHVPKHWGLPLVVFPVPGGTWNLPHTMWHLDAPASGSDPLPPGLRAFAFLDKVGPRGGATAVVAGSHRRVQKLAGEITPEATLRSEKARRELARAEPWIKDLFTAGDAEERVKHFMTEGTVSSGIPLRVVELTGEPGDIVLMDLRCLHTLSPNVANAPRLVIAPILLRIA